MNTRQVFRWLRNPGHRIGSEVMPEAAASCLRPVERHAETEIPLAAPVTGYHSGIELFGGHRVRTSGSHVSETFARLVGGVSA